MTRKKSRIKIPLIIFIFLLVITYLVIRPYLVFATKITNVSPLAMLLLSGEFKKTGDKTNFVLLGKAGGHHDGPNLTDSIFVVSVDYKVKKISTISVPRDIWSSTLEDKINSAYAYGEAKKKGGGMILAKSEIGAIVDLPIHYAIVIDFEKFTHFIDDVGGVDINVDNSFTDDKFPITGQENNPCDGDPDYLCRYKSVSFQKGLQHMDGNTALEFVRSRNATGPEGTDFARGARQRKVIGALIEKIYDILKTRNIDKIEGLYNQVNKTIERDIDNADSLFIAKKILLNKKFSSQTYSLPEEIFEIPQRRFYLGKYVLIPRDGSFKIVHQFVACMSEKSDQSVCLKNIK